MCNSNENRVIQNNFINIFHEFMEQPSYNDVIYQADVELNRVLKQSGQGYSM